MPKLHDEQVQAPIDAAIAARRHAYAPYSVHRVGAAVLDAAGRIHAGCNIEFVTLSQTVHAERTAVLNMVSSRARQLTAVCVVGPYFGVPCAECRQSTCEFACADGRLGRIADARRNLSAPLRTRNQEHRSPQRLNVRNGRVRHQECQS